MRKHWGKFNVTKFNKFVEVSAALLVVAMFIFWVATTAWADPPDNRPPGGGDVTGSVESVIENRVTVNSSAHSGAAANANAIVESGAMGDNNVNMDSRSLALVNTLGDVSISDCRESEQFGTPVFSRQWIQLNPWCAAEVYDSKGLHELAARTRCTIKEISRLFDDAESCVAANTVKPAPAPVVIAHDQDAELERQLAVTMDYAGVLEARLNDLEQLAQQVPEQKTVVQQIPYLSAEKRAKLAELRDE